jgi:uncharacterized membrane protein
MEVQVMKVSKKGVMVATAVAGLFAANIAVADHHEAADGAKAGAKVKCEGINSCKGTGACGGAGHGCAGKNECKGKGWVTTSSAKECTDKGGKVVN